MLEAHEAILQVIKTVPAAGPDNAPLTPDMGGRGGTQDLGRAIADALLCPVALKLIRIRRQSGWSEMRTQNQAQHHDTVCWH